MTTAPAEAAATTRLDLDRAQILAHRRRVSALDERLPPGAGSLRHAAWAGLQDSMPRAALLSIHARVAGTEPTVLDDPALVQLWGPRYSAFAVAAEDRAVFTLGRLFDSADRRKFAEDIADRLEAFLDGRRMSCTPVGRALGIHPNALRYAAPTGRVLIEWDGARQPTVWTVPRPDVDPMDARIELARRYLHVFGPTTAEAFGEWAGIKPAGSRAAFDALSASLVGVRTPLGDAWILGDDEASFRSPAEASAAARLLPSGDTYYQLWGAGRELLVPEADRRSMLWTSRVWPGGVLVRGDLVGTWRRANAAVTIQPWVRLSPGDRAAVTAEAEDLPLPGLVGRITVQWDDGSS